jgi:hypothetical protein
MATMRAPRLLVVFVFLAVFAVVAAGCSRDTANSLPRPGKAFCEAAYRYDVRVEKHASLDEQIKIVKQMATHAPKDVAHDTNVFLDALERRRDGDLSVVDNPKIENAVNHVNRRAASGCGLYKSNSGGGI